MYLDIEIHFIPFRFGELDHSSYAWSTNFVIVCLISLINLILTLILSAILTN